MQHSPGGEALSPITPIPDDRLNLLLGKVGNHEVKVALAAYHLQQPQDSYLASEADYALRSRQEQYINWVPTHTVFHHFYRHGLLPAEVVTATPYLLPHKPKHPTSLYRANTDGLVPNLAFCGAIMRWSRDHDDLSVQHTLSGLSGERGAFMTGQLRLWLFRQLTTPRALEFGAPWGDLRSGIQRESRQQIAAERLGQHIETLNHFGIVRGEAKFGNDIHLNPKFAIAIGSLVIHMDNLQGHTKGRFDDKIADVMRFYAGQARHILNTPTELAALYAKANRSSSWTTGIKIGKEATSELILSIIRESGESATLTSVLSTLHAQGRKMSLSNLRLYVNELYDTGKIVARHPDTHTQVETIGKHSRLGAAGPRILLTKYDMQSMAMEHGFPSIIGTMAHRLCVQLAKGDYKVGTVDVVDHYEGRRYDPRVVAPTLAPVVRRWVQHGYNRIPRLPITITGERTVHFLAKMLNAIYPQLNPRLPVPEDILAPPPEYVNDMEWTLMKDQGTLLVTARALFEIGKRQGELPPRQVHKAITALFSKMVDAALSERGIEPPHLGTPKIPLPVTDKITYLGQERTAARNQYPIYGLDPSFFLKKVDELLASDQNLPRNVLPILTAYAERIREHL
jgi:hypothetical protein